jgi:NAD(P)-dependent dehydrogenase (short-subunit alcohol dehydrogenase family)
MARRLDALFSLEGRTALVTGGSSGIGLAIATALGMQGARLLLASRSAAVLDEVADRLAADGIEAADCAVDLAEADGPDRLAAAAEALGLAIDVIVHAAGVNLREPFQQVSAAAFDLHMAIHLRAPFRLVQLFAPAMAARGWGRVILVGSLQSWRAFPDSAPYGAAKGGVVQLVRAIAEAWSPRGVTCNAIAPGFFPTPLTRAVFDDPVLAADRAAHTAIGRNGALPDLYGTAIFLASDASAYVTGQTLAVDGGFTAK